MAFAAQATDPYEQTGSLLGRRKSKRGAAQDSMMAALRQGLSPRSVESLARNTGIAEEVIVQFIAISDRTWQRRRQDTKPLSQLQSDRLYRLAEAIVRATDVLGSREKAVRWLLKKNRALRAVPIELLDNEIGEGLVRDTLNRIKFGVFS